MLADAAQYIAANRISELEESQTLALARRVREMKARGVPVVSLTLGEPDFDTPLHIREAAKKAIDEGITHYPPVPGFPELREAVAAQFHSNNGLAYKAENIVISTGAKQSILNAMMSLVNPGDEVILVAPYWVSYYPMVKMAGGKPIIVQTTQTTGLKITPAQLESAITPNTRLLVHNSPSNPTGAIYTREEMEALAEVLRRHPQVFILSDEIYQLISYGEPHISPGALPGLFDRTITINGASKAYAMTGWRVGFMGAPKWIAQACEKYQGQVTSGTSTISQMAALAAVTGDHGPTSAMVAEFKRRRDLVCGLIHTALPHFGLEVPHGAFYLFPDVSYYFGAHTPEGHVLHNADDFAEYLLEKALVSVVTGVAFGSNTHIRMSYACAEADLRLAVERITEALNLLH